MNAVALAVARYRATVDASIKALESIVAARIAPSRPSPSSGYPDTASPLVHRLAADPELVQLRPAIASGKTAAMWAFVRRLCTLVDATYEVHGGPQGLTRVDLIRRHVYGPAMGSSKDFADWLHEAAHLLVGPCAGPLHWRTRDHGCLRCETLAWHHAMTLYPFDRTMFAEVRQTLGTYRAVTASSRAAAWEAERLQGTATFARRCNFTARLDLQRQHRESLARQRDVFGVGRSLANARRLLDRQR